MRYLFVAVILATLVACTTSTQLHYQSDQRELSLNRTIDTSHDK